MTTAQEEGEAAGAGRGGHRKQQLAPGQQEHAAEAGMSSTERLEKRIASNVAPADDELPLRRVR
jgi:hypothetical protein